MEEIFNDLYRKYHSDLFQFLYYTVRNREQAEDLVQEVYIRVFKSYSTFEKRSSERTWLFSIARNVAIDFFRKQKGLKGKTLSKFGLETLQIQDQLPLPEEVAMEREDINSIHASLKQCKLEQRMVIILRYLQDLSISETARTLGWTEAKVKTTQHRALKKLKSFLQEESSIEKFSKGYLAKKRESFFHLFPSM
ncbi:RNA polymerase sigma factor SigX [Mesobacillus foraminis]|uniref:RNA polymerase sigma factor SigX n=1 Tax=Mesobacillus foraminis TaxID=279826 RepID=UPI001BE623E5|nr:RNA polymerase sigma factor SigX [Mesobacillus foraminis]MBT2757004.1 RNA polymerase sigma factor SigX [Mesobacillus foraminis]